MKANLHPYVELTCEPCLVCDGAVDPHTGVCRECAHDNWAERITSSERLPRRTRTERVEVRRSREDSEGHVAAAWLAAWPGLMLLLYLIFDPTLGLLVCGALFVPVVAAAVAWVGLEALDDDDEAAWRFARGLAYSAGVVLLGLGVAAGLMEQIGALFALLPLAHVVGVIVTRHRASPTTVIAFFGRFLWRVLR